MDELRRVHPPAGQASFRGMTPGAVALALLLKYVFLTLYAIHATISLVPSFVTVGGRAFSVIWSLIVGVLSVLATIGVIRSWYTNRVRLEKITTALLILGLLGYSVAIAIRGIAFGEWEGVAIAWIPIALVVFPTIRYYWLVWTA